MSQNKYFSSLTIITKSPVGERVKDTNVQINIKGKSNLVLLLEAK